MPVLDAPPRRGMSQARSLSIIPHCVFLENIPPGIRQQHNSGKNEQAGLEQNIVERDGENVPIAIYNDSRVRPESLSETGTDSRYGSDDAERK